MLMRAVIALTVLLFAGEATARALRKRRSKKVGFASCMAPLGAALEETVRIRTLACMLPLGFALVANGCAGREWGAYCRRYACSEADALIVENRAQRRCALAEQAYRNLTGEAFPANDSLFTENTNPDVGKWPWRAISMSEPFEDARRSSWETLRRCAIRAEAMWKAVCERRHPAGLEEPGYIGCIGPPHTLPWWNGWSYPPPDFRSLAELDLRARENASSLIRDGCGFDERDARICPEGDAERRGR